MFATLLCLSVMAPPALAPSAARPANPAEATASLDGNWTIVCIEKNGQPVTEAKGKTFTVKDNTFTCAGKDGKSTMSFKVEFTKDGVVNVTEIATEEGVKADDTVTAKKAGVYVLTSDFLAICVHDTRAASDASITGTPLAKSHCSIILTREGAKLDR